MNFLRHFLMLGTTALLVSFSALYSQPVPQYQLSIQNPVLVGNTYQFDIFLKRIGPTNFRVGNSQFIMSFNSGSFISPVISRVASSEEIGTGFFFDQVIAASELWISLGGNGSYAEALDIATSGAGTRISTFSITGVNVPILSAGLTWINSPALIRTGVSEIDPSDNYREITDASGGSNIGGGGEFARISGYKFNDINGNGHWDQAEPPLNGWSIVISGPNGTLAATTGTGSWPAGFYEFVNLTPGIYSIDEVSQGGWSQTVSPASPFVLVAGQNSPNSNFGNFQGSVARGIKFNDINKNGIKDAGEPGIAGWEIVATKVGGGGIKTDSTDGSGNYSFGFSSFESGDWVISESQQPGWRQTFPASPGTYTVSIQSGTYEAGKDFGNFLSSSISGTKFNDINGDSLKNPGEPGLANWRIYLFQNSIHIDTTITDSIGNYSFTGLIPGTYMVSEELQDGWTQTMPGFSGTYTVVISTPGTSISGKDFGNALFSSISGFVYYDLNRNGTQDTLEPGMAGMTVRINRPGGGDSLETVSAIGGRWAFGNLAPGIYTLWEPYAGDSKYRITEPPGGTYTEILTSGSAVTNVKFGNSPAIDTVKFRTVSYDSLALSMNNKGKKGKPVNKKNDKVQFCSSFINTTGMGVDGMHVSYVVTLYIGDPTYPLTITPTPSSISFDSKARTAEIRWPDTLARYSSVQICGWGKRSLTQRGFYYWELKGKKLNSNKFYNPIAFSLNIPRLPMPNEENVCQEVYDLSGFSPPQTGGLVTGIAQPNNSKGWGWVGLRKAIDAFKSFSDRGQLHTINTRGFDYFNLTASGLQKRFTKGQRTLTPRKQNNRLFADLVALKINLTASALQVIPAGLGELLFDDGVNSLSGRSLREIAATADTALTYYHGINATYYTNLDTVIRKINSAFDGPVDTISFATRLMLRGIRPLEDIPYLRANPNAVPFMIPERDIVRAEIPDDFRLYQNFPNPFNPTTTIRFELPQDAVVTLKIYNLLGQEVASLISQEEFDSGTNEIEFDASSLSSGVYFYRMTASVIDDEGDTGGITYSQINKMVLLK